MFCDVCNIKVVDGKGSRKIGTGTINA